MTWGRLFVVAVFAAGCSTATPAAVTPFDKPASYATLVDRAGLDACPATTTTSHAAHALPNLTLPCLGRGPAVHLSGLVGAPTVVNIWGTWCGPCQAETKYLSQVYDAMRGKVRFLGVDTEDDPKSALDFAPHVTPRMRYPQVADKDKRLLIALLLPSAVPTTVFVSASGSVVHVSPGAYHSAASLRADIRRYLGVAS
jgi:cytochrome c biogenesis protein CcmG/thiol:disulfide interchange protein DsbE